MSSPGSTPRISLVPIRPSSPVRRPVSPPRVAVNFLRDLEAAQGNPPAPFPALLDNVQTFLFTPPVMPALPLTQQAVAIQTAVNAIRDGLNRELGQIFGRYAAPCEARTTAINGLLDQIIQNNAPGNRPLRDAYQEALGQILVAVALALLPDQAKDVISVIFNRVQQEQARPSRSPLLQGFAERYFSQGFQNFQVFETCPAPAANFRGIDITKYRPDHITGLRLNPPRDNVTQDFALYIKGSNLVTFPSPGLVNALQLLTAENLVHMAFFLDQGTLPGAVLTSEQIGFVIGVGLVNKPVQVVTTTLRSLEAIYPLPTAAANRTAFLHGIAEGLIHTTTTNKLSHEVATAFFNILREDLLLGPLPQLRPTNPTLFLLLLQVAEQNPEFAKVLRGLDLAVLVPYRNLLFPVPTAPPFAPPAAPFRTQFISLAAANRVFLTAFTANPALTYSGVNEALAFTAPEQALLGAIAEEDRASIIDAIKTILASPTPIPEAQLREIGDKFRDLSVDGADDIGRLIQARLDNARLIPGGTPNHAGLTSLVTNLLAPTLANSASIINAIKTILESSTPTTPIPEAQLRTIRDKFRDLSVDGANEIRTLIEAKLANSRSIPRGTQEHVGLTDLVTNLLELVLPSMQGFHLPRSRGNMYVLKKYLDNCREKGLAVDLTTLATTLAAWKSRFSVGTNRRSDRTSLIDALLAKINPGTATRTRADAFTALSDTFTRAVNDLSRLNPTELQDQNAYFSTESVNFTFMKDLIAQIALAEGDTAAADSGPKGVLLNFAAKAKDNTYLQQQFLLAIRLVLKDPNITPAQVKILLANLGFIQGSIKPENQALAANTIAQAAVVIGTLEPVPGDLAALLTPIQDANNKKQPTEYYKTYLEEGAKLVAFLKSRPRYSDPNQAASKALVDAMEAALTKFKTLKTAGPPPKDLTASLADPAKIASLDFTPEDYLKLHQAFLDVAAKKRLIFSDNWNDAQPVALFFDETELRFLPAIPAPPPAPQVPPGTPNPALVLETQLKTQILVGDNLLAVLDNDELTQNAKKLYAKIETAKKNPTNTLFLAMVNDELTKFQTKVTTAVTTAVRSGRNVVLDRMFENWINQDVLSITGLAQNNDLYYRLANRALTVYLNPPDPIQQQAAFTFLTKLFGLDFSNKEKALCFSKILQNQAALVGRPPESVAKKKLLEDTVLKPFLSYMVQNADSEIDPVIFTQPTFALIQQQKLLPEGEYVTDPAPTQQVKLYVDRPLPLVQEVIANPEVANLPYRSQAVLVNLLNYFLRQTTATIPTLPYIVNQILDALLPKMEVSTKPTPITVVVVGQPVSVTKYVQIAQPQDRALQTLFPRLVAVTATRRLAVGQLPANPTTGVVPPAAYYLIDTEA